MVLVGVLALALPLATGLTYELGDTFDCAFYAACCLVVWYLIAGALRWLLPHVGESLRDSHPVSERPGHVATVPAPGPGLSSPPPAPQP